MAALIGDDHATDLEKKSVEAQAEAANKAGSWHFLVITSDRDAILQLVEEDPDAIHSRGPVGETILHFLLLLCVVTIPTHVYAHTQTHTHSHTHARARAHTRTHTNAYVHRSYVHCTLCYDTIDAYDTRCLTRAQPLLPPQHSPSRSSPERTEICKELIEMFPESIMDVYIGEP
jgi:hypothetical protein